MTGKIAVLLISFLAFTLAFLGAGEAEGASDVHAASAPPPYWTVVPFILMLTGIAAIPLVMPHWWQRNRNKGILSLVLGGTMLLYLYFFAPEGARERIAITLLEYIAFISLLASLFIIAGGIYLKGSLAGTPIGNTFLLLIGAVLASFMGTTGAAMILIRPFIRANAWRKARYLQIIFFIFLVANIGGLLTPLGDPPLFLGFLKKVPFQWTFRLWPYWLFTVFLVLATFYVVDSLKYKQELREGVVPPRGEKEPFRIEGWQNFIFLALIIGVLLAAGTISQKGLVKVWTGIEDHLVIDLIEKVGQSVAMLAVAAVAYRLTRKETREANNFTWGPIAEVAILFIGIFITMIPALWILNYLGAGNKLGIDKPWQFFWAAGSLSTFLDNAPTYLTFTAAASGLNQTDPNNLLELIQKTGEQTSLGFDGNRYLEAVSTGTVFMGANSYIGNGPNFMVKAIAEENGIRMPSFFGYMFYSALFLVPTFVLFTLLFLSGLVL